MTIQLAKRRNLFLLFAVAIAAIATTFVYTGVASGDDDNDNGNGKRYEVTITNITKGQIISPAVVATHRSSLDPIFMLGSPASDEPCRDQAVVWARASPREQGQARPPRSARHRGASS